MISGVSNALEQQHEDAYQPLIKGLTSVLYLSKELHDIAAQEGGRLVCRRTPTGQ